MKKKQYKKISQWQKETFGHATAHSKVCHLKEEVIELEQELNKQFNKYAYGIC